jgi:hypothetical protein
MNSAWACNFARCLYGTSADGVDAVRGCQRTRRIEGPAREPRPGSSNDRRRPERSRRRSHVGAHPKNATHWSRSSTALLSGLPESTVSRIWTAFTPSHIRSAPARRPPTCGSSTRSAIPSARTQPTAEGPRPACGREVEVKVPGAGPLPTPRFHMHDTLTWSDTRTRSSAGSPCSPTSAATRRPQNGPGAEEGNPRLDQVMQ